MLVVGLGSIGRRHARLLAERDDVVVELCDPADAMLDLAVSEAGDLARHHDLDEALATGPDCVVVATPHQRHVDQTLAALGAGAHVLCEKPVSDRVGEGLRLLGHRADRVLSFGFHLHFHPAVRRVTQLLADGALGEPVHFSAHVGSYVTLRNSASRYQAELPGALLLDYTHQADLAAHLLGVAPAGVYALGVDVPGPQLRSSPMMIDMVLDHPGGRTSLVHLDYVQDPDREDFEVVGTRGWAHYDPKSGRLRHASEGGEVVGERLRPERDDIYRAEHEAFFAAVDGAREPESPIGSALVSLRVAEAAMRSIATGQRVAISA